MNNLVCKDCKSTDVTEYPPGMFGEPRHRCNSCGNISRTEDFVEPTVFDRITASPEVLAENLVYIIRCEADPSLAGWTSNVVQSVFETRSEAIAATVARLKEVCND